MDHTQLLIQTLYVCSSGVDPPRKFSLCDANHNEIFYAARKHLMKMMENRIFY